MLKPIQTHYKGYHFRSRTEARWAVAFDELDIQYQYEPEGFDLGQAGYYLPDFYLPQVDMYAEVKGKTFTLEELKTAQMEKPFSFTKGVPVMKIKNDDKGPSIGNSNGGDNMGFVDTESALYDMINDPGQLNKLDDENIISNMNDLIYDKMIENDAPKEVVNRFFKK